MASNRQALSGDKAVSVSDFNGHRYVHIRRFFEKDGQRFLKKEGGPLYSDESKEFQSTARGIGRTWGECRWDLDMRSYVQKNTDGSVVFGIRARVWDNGSSGGVGHAP